MCYNWSYLQFIIVYNLLFLSLLSGVLSSRIQISNNGYSNIVVAISSHIDQTEGKRLIPKIKELFTNGSQSLYIATRYRAYFQQVTIVVPSTWDSKEYKDKATFETFVDADVRIARPNPAYGNGPYTLQSMGCGSPGQYIHLTPEYLNNLSDNSTELFGDPGKTLVHEWAHLRYGIFDEHGGREKFPILYFEEDYELVPNACSDGKLEGTFKDALSNKKCKSIKGYPDHNCIFVPDMNKNNVTTSIASYHFLPYVSYFCDNTNHNTRAPNKHNLLCNSRSTWEVIMDHEDFQNNNNPPKDISKLKPEFKVLQSLSATLYLLLDLSKATPDDSKQRKMILNVIDMWRSHEAPYNFNIFNSPIITGSASSRDISAQIIEAMNTLKTSRGIDGGTIIFITDGKSGEIMINNGIVEKVKDRKVRFTTIALSNEASEDIKKLSVVSGGQIYFDPTTNSVLLINILYEITKYHAPEMDLEVLIHQAIFAKGKKEIEDFFAIDSTIVRTGSGLRFINVNAYDLNWLKINNIFLTNTVIPKTNELRDAKEKPYFFFYFDTDMFGIHHYKLNFNKTSTEIITATTLSYTTHPSKNNPIRTRCWISKLQNKNQNKPHYIIFAEVKQENKPVINANVTATVDRPKENRVFLTLFDNGNEPDVTRNDGIYSRYFTKFNGKGSYSIQAFVTNGGTASIVDMGFTASNSMPVVNKYMADITSNTRSTGMFERFATAEDMNVHEYTNEENFPPRKITDLTVVNVTVFHNYTTIGLQWTAPGESLDVGQARSYVMRYSDNWDDLYHNFDSTTDSNVVITPSVAETQEYVEVNVSGLVENVTYYMGLRTHNNDNKVSDTSNIVFAQVIVCIEEEEDYLLAIVVGIFLCTLFIIFLVAGTLFIKFKKKDEN